MRDPLKSLLSHLPDDLVDRWLVARLPPALRPIPGILGGVLIMLTIGTVYTFGNVMPYMVSYLHERVSPSYTPATQSWVMAIQGGVPFMMVVGGVLERRYGVRVQAVIGNCLVSGGVLLTYFSIKIGFIPQILTYGVMFGCGLTFSYGACLLTANRWLPKRAGLATGLIASAFGFGAFVFSPIQTLYVNPDNLETVDGGDGHRYFTDPELLDRVPKLFLLTGSMFAVIQAIGTILLVQPPPVEAKSVDDVPPTNDEVTAHATAPSLEKSAVPSTARLPQNLRPTACVKEVTFWMLVCAFFLNATMVTFVGSYWKSYGQMFINDDHFMATVASVSSIFNAAGRIVFGSLADRFSFQSVACVAATLMSALLFTLRATEEMSRIFFMLWVCGLFFTLSSSFALFPAAVKRCFGTDFFVVTYGMVFAAVSINGLVMSVVTTLLMHAIGYNGLWYIGAACTESAFVILASLHKTSYGKRVSIGMQK